MSDKTVADALSQPLRCQCGFDGWTIFDSAIQCIRCEAIYKRPKSVEPFNKRPTRWRLRRGKEVVPWQEFCGG